MKLPAWTILALCLGATAGADFITQTDWSSGPGLEGPVSSWDPFFDSCSSIDWFDMNGVLALGADRSDTQTLISS